MDTRETFLEGKAICLASLTNSWDEVIITHITIPAIYTSDWQEDGGFVHDEGNFDYDIEEAYPTYPDEYEIVTTDGKIKEGSGSIKKLKAILKYDLTERI